MHRISHKVLARLALAAGCAVLPARLSAQADSGMMDHGAGMSKGEMMDHDSGMMKSDGMGMAHEGAMGHETMEPNRMFMGASGHKAAGDYAIEESGGRTRITLTPDFAVDNDGDAYLVLSAADTPGEDALWLGKVKSRKAGQSFTLPKGTDLSHYRKVLVWSKKSASALASADLGSEGGMMMEH